MFKLKMFLFVISDSMVKEFVANNDVRQITRLTTVLADEFAVLHNNHSRKGGLIGLAATAIALGKVQVHNKHC